VGRTNIFYGPHKTDIFSNCPAVAFTSIRARKNRRLIDTGIRHQSLHHFQCHWAHSKTIFSSFESTIMKGLIPAFTPLGRGERIYTHRPAPFLKLNVLLITKFNDQTVLTHVG
jgi:hypothetical protein